MTWYSSDSEPHEPSWISLVLVGIVANVVLIVPFVRR
jgi:hypothetical protein